MNTMRRALGTALVSGLMLAGCGNTVQQAFGLGKRSPDEFQVVRRQPLIMPPDMRLPPPQSGDTSASGTRTAEEARAALVGSGASRSGRAEQSSAEQALLQAAKTPSEPDIRQKLLSENTQLTGLDDRTFLFILDWQRQRAQQRSGETLDPAVEARRLQEGRVSTVRLGSGP